MLVSLSSISGLFSVMFVYLCSRAMMLLAVLESSPVVGSSRKRSDGEVMSSIPMAQRFLSPPDTPLRN